MEQVEASQPQVRKGVVDEEEFEEEEEELEKVQEKEEGEEKERNDTYVNFMLGGDGGEGHDGGEVSISNKIRNSCRSTPRESMHQHLLPSPLEVVVELGAVQQTMLTSSKQPNSVLVR